MTEFDAWRSCARFHCSLLVVGSSSLTLCVCCVFVVSVIFTACNFLLYSRAGQATAEGCVVNPSSLGDAKAQVYLASWARHVGPARARLYKARPRHSPARLPSCPCLARPGGSAVLGPQFRSAVSLRARHDFWVARCGPMYLNH